MAAIQIADWLTRLGLAQYLECFAENDIDFSVLRDLTDADLEKIGIRSLGHRRKLLRAITDLREVEASAPAVATTSDAPTASRSLDSAERRQVTVLFSDLVGSAALSTRMDPYGPGRSASGHFGLSESSCRNRAPVRWVRGEIHGRWRARLFRVSTRTRGRCRAGGTGRTRAHRGSDRARVARCAASPCRNCDRDRRRRRSDRIGGGAGARHCGRDAEPGGAAPGDRRTEYSGYRREHAKSCRQSL